MLWPLGRLNEDSEGSKWQHQEDLMFSWIHDSQAVTSCSVTGSNLFFCYFKLRLNTHRATRCQAWLALSVSLKRICLTEPVHSDVLAKYSSCSVLFHVITSPSWPILSTWITAPSRSDVPQSEHFQLVSFVRPKVFLLMYHFCFLFFSTE